MKKISRIILAIISFIKNSGSFIKNIGISIWEISMTILFTAMVFAAGAVILSIPFYGWYFSIIASAIVFALQHRINRFLLIAILLLYGPIIALAGALTIWQDLLIVAIIQGAICWLIFLGLFLLTWYLGYSEPRQKQAQLPQ
ncbi:MAG: hypothetical protein WCT16_00640 [Candidatus Buchananbacteria bacterium]